MGRLSPIQEQQRNACVTAVDGLVGSGRAASVSEAAGIIYRTARRTHQPTGFDMTSSRRFYWCLRKWYDKKRSG